MAEMNVGQMIARREELKQTLASLPAIRREINLLNELIVLHDPISADDKPRPQRYGIPLPGHRPCPEAIDLTAWKRSEIRRLEGGEKCDRCELYFHQGQSMHRHVDIMHEGGSNGRHKGGNK